MTAIHVLGVDVGTSGVRCVALDQHNEITAAAARTFVASGANGRDPAAWAELCDQAILDVLGRIERDSVQAIAFDGTSGTLLAVDADGEPLASPLMYNDPVPDQSIVDRVGAAAPMDSAAHGATSGLAKALLLQSVPSVTHVLHQADWLAGRLTRRWDVTDENNALKTGYDPVASRWGDWIEGTGLRAGLLPHVVPAGTPVASVAADVARRFNLSRSVQVVAGTTDGCASFLATGARDIGDAVTALGSSLTLKILSDRPIFSPAHGIYSHRIAGGWLAGGASNTGGQVLMSFFTGDQLAALSTRIDPSRVARLGFYPLLAKGERFPLADPDKQPCIAPRPDDDAEFLHELFAGIAAIEAKGYECLTALGAPRLRSVRSVGGGARNPVWTAMRQSRLNAPFLTARSHEAAAGVAWLALRSLREGVPA